MNRINKAFENCKKNVLNIFCTAGYPQLESTISVMLSLQQHGADLIEIGMPYSDPIADGPVIQESNMIALENGMTMQLLFEQLECVKDKIGIPVILMGYLNPVLQFGIEKFCAAASAAGVDGVILPDLPMYEYERFYKKIFEKHHLCLIFLITPETSISRIKKADELSSGFLYAVSSSSTTGNAVNQLSREKYFKRLALLKLKNPVLIGFGINDRRSFMDACAHSSGAIIGSAYMRSIAHSIDIDHDTKVFLKNIKEGIE